MTQLTPASTRTTFERHASLPACTLNLDALEAIEQAVPPEFDTKWTASGRGMSVDGPKVTEVLATVPGDVRVTSLRLSAYRHSDRASVYLSVDRYFTWLAVNGEHDTATLRGIQESILDTCRHHRALWQRFLKGRAGLAVYVTGLLLALAWVPLAVFFTAPHGNEKVVVEALTAGMNILGDLGMLAYVVALLYPSVRITAANTKKSSILQWQQLAANFFVAVSAA